MASSNIARLGIVLGVDTAELEVKISKAKQEFGSFAKQIQRDSDNAAKDLVALRYATEDYGKTLTKVEQIEREIKAGRYQRAEGSLIDMLRKEAAAYDAKANAMKNMAGAQFKMNEQQKLQLTYQTTDLFTQIASGQSPFIALIQQGGQLKDSMGGVNNMFRAIGTLFTPFSVGLGTVAAAFGAVAFAIYEADKEFDKFQDSLTLTGNYAGVTAKELVAMSTAIASTANVTIGKATDALDALVASGKFTKTSLDSVTNAVLVYAKIAGVDGKEAAEKLMSGLDGTASGAKQLNDKMNFLTFAQYKQIEALDKAGKKQEAAKLAADILTERLEAQKRILGETEGAWDKATKALSGYWDRFKKAFFEGESPEDKLERMNNQIKVLQTGLRNATGDEPFFVSKTKELEALIKRRDEFADLMNERDASVVAPDQKGKISSDAQYGEMLKAKNIEVQKAISEAAFAEAKVRLNEIERIEREASDKIANARLEMNEKNRREEYRAQTQNLTIFTENEIVIRAEAAEKIKQIRSKERIATNKAQAEEKQAIEDINNAYVGMVANLEFAAKEKTRMMGLDKEDLQLRYQLIYATEEELKLAQIAMKYQREREKANANPVLLENLDKQEAIEKMLVSMQEAGKRTQEVFDSVWGSMSAAIDSFVKNGKLNMKDFARSTIQSLIAIEMKMQAMSLLRGLFSSFAGSFSGGGFGTGKAFGNMDLGGFLAEGGPAQANTPYIIGERGPELFVPRTAGTVVPNNALSGMGGQTINYNGPIIQNMSAIDTQSGLQFLAKNKQGVFAAYQSANRSIPVSR
jgi:phage-related minor tail protein